jgi:hypothetical protein
MSPSPVQTPNLKRTEVTLEQMLQQLMLPKSGPWKRLREKIRKQRFSRSLEHDFSWFFQGVSEVQALSIEEVCEFLVSCQYISDEELFMERDFWQHPVTFEKTKMGDCEDHALWAWRKLSEIGVEAELVVGKLKDTEEYQYIAAPAGGHAWVIFREPESSKWRVLEATAKNKQGMILAPEDAKDTHKAQFSIDRKYRTYRFTDYKE